MLLSHPFSAAAFSRDASGGNFKQSVADSEKRPECDCNSDHCRNHTPYEIMYLSGII